MKRILSLIFLMICFTYSYFAQCKDETGGLVVRGKVTDLQIEKTDKDYIWFNVTLAMEFHNENNQSIILFKPNTNNSYFEDRYYLGGTSLSLNENGQTILSNGAWESIMGSQFYKDLANGLDTKVPLEEYTKIIQPNTSWNFSDKTDIVFDNEEDKYGSNKSWKDMQTLPSKLWLRVLYELNPWNVEYFKPKLLRKLKKRWKNYGNVLIEKDAKRFSHFIICSEPMEIDFSQFKE